MENVIDPSQLFSIRGKTAVVSGGSRGLGKMIAGGFVAAGVRVYICARKADACDATAAELGRAGECVSLPADLSTLAGVKDFASRLKEREGRVHILVNNAGAAWGAPLEEYPESGFDKVLDVNVKAVFQLTQQLLPLLRSAATKEDPARVINIGSIDGLRVPSAESYAYSASKAAVHMLTRHLASALVGDHINVNAIAPGLFPSRMTAYMFESESAGEVVEGIPMKRAGSPEDIAGTAIYLSSRASAYLTGVVLPVAGGLATIA